VSRRPAKRGASANLSGAWSGVYSYDGNLRSPVSFSAKLTQKGRWIVGATEEVAEVGEAIGTVIFATIQGRRNGASVSWLKLYDRMLRGYNEVAYEGQVNADATEISGQWRIPGNWTGTFLMIRSSSLIFARRIATEEGI
jgi:hypothetical protein